MKQLDKAFLKTIGNDWFFIEYINDITDEMKTQKIKSWREKNRKIEALQENTSSYFRHLYN